MIPEISRQTNEKASTVFCSQPFNFSRLKIAVPAEINIKANAKKEIHIFINACDNSITPSDDHSYYSISGKKNGILTTISHKNVVA